MAHLAPELDLPEMLLDERIVDAATRRLRDLPADAWLARNLFGYARAGTTTTSSASCATSAGTAPSGRIPELMGITDERLPRPPARQHPVAPRATCTRGCADWSRRRSRRARPTDCARSCARSSTASSTRWPPAGTRRLRGRHLRAVPDPDHLRAARRAEERLAAVQPLGQRHPRDLLRRPGRQARPRSCARRTSWTRTPAS